MNGTIVKYSIKTATEKEIWLHLINCNDNFLPPLNQRVNIEEYANKIFERSVTFEAWNKDILTGLIAVYFSLESSVQNAFITNVSILRESMHIGISSALMKMCIIYTQNNHVQELNLEVFENNSTAISFYRKFNFVEYGRKENFILMKLKVI